MPRRGHRLPGKLALWALFWVLGGLLSMHGLSNHGTGAAAHDAHGPAAESSMPGMATVTAVAASPAPLSLTAPGAPGLEHLLAACLVVLGVALLVYLGGGRPLGVRGASGPLLGVDLIRAQGRDPAPPDLVRLSICRC